MLLHSQLTEVVLECFYKVYNVLGYGFLEKVYAGALKIELEKKGLLVIPQAKINVLYEGQYVGIYYADMLVEDSVIIEIKAVANLLEEHEAQLLNYLKATNIEVGLLLNFGLKPTFKRKIYTNDRK
jgi:GxxExxY protein